MRHLLAALAVLVTLVLPAHAVEPSEILDDPALEARARELSAELRCMVCQNQSIDDSNAPLARDLRRLVRERLIAGDSDEEIMTYLVARYGDFVLLKPRFAGKTILLWATPFAVLALAGLAVLLRSRGRRSAPEALTAEEEARLRDLLDEA